MPDSSKGPVKGQLELAVRRTVKVPDRKRLARYLRAPELGPNICFFSGGSAIGELSEELIKYSHNTTHLITPFDSGGSSAKLRQAFHMPAVGDLRNRMMSLADKTVRGNPEVVRLFSTRLDKEWDQQRLRERLDDMVCGREPLVAAIPDPLRKIIRNHLGFIYDQLPAGFDLSGASIGNLVLVGGYLNNGRHLDPVIYLFSKLAEVRGVVRPIISSDLQLAVRLQDGSVIVGQHLITGREVPPLESPVAEVWISDKDGKQAETPSIRSKVDSLIRQAELICYPMGSFYSSVIANLLPGGVAEAVCRNACPKVFIPNTGRDKEMLQGSAAFQVREILKALKCDATPQGAGKALHYVLVDMANGYYRNGLGLDDLQGLGVKVLDLPLVKKNDFTRMDPELLASALLSLA